MEAPLQKGRVRSIALARRSTHAGIGNESVINDMQEANTMLQSRAATPIAKFVADVGQKAHVPIMKTIPLRGSGDTSRVRNEAHSAGFCADCLQSLQTLEIMSSRCICEPERAYLTKVCGFFCLS